MLQPKRQLIVFLLLIFVSFGTILSCSNIKASPQNKIPANLFGMHMHRVATTGVYSSDSQIRDLTPWPSVPFASWRLISAYVEWFHLEPEKGKWDFEILDKSLELAEKHNVEILLPLGLTPRWAASEPPQERSGYPYGWWTTTPPKNIEDWRNYVRTVAERYKGRIHYYELWNEANWEKFYTGSIEKMLELSREAYQILKEVDPTITVVSPSAANLAFMDNKGLQWLDEYLAKGGGDYADAIGYHFYINVNPPEKFVPVIRQAREIMAKYGQDEKELWNTEAGWPGSSSSRSDEEVAGFVARAYIMNWDAGVSRFYWYSWDNRGTTVPMVEEDRTTLTQAAIAYRETYKWLVGSRMSPCQSNSQNTWICQLTRDRRYQGWIVWNPDGKLRFNVPDRWRVKQIRDLAGTQRDLSGNSIEIGPSPLLLEK